MGTGLYAVERDPDSALWPAATARGEFYACQIASVRGAPGSHSSTDLTPDSTLGTGPPASTSAGSTPPQPPPPPPEVAVLEQALSELAARGLPRPLLFCLDGLTHSELAAVAAAVVRARGAPPRGGGSGSGRLWLAATLAAPDDDAGPPELGPGLGPITQGVRCRWLRLFSRPLSATATMNTTTSHLLSCCSRPGPDNGCPDSDCILATRLDAEPWLRRNCDFVLVGLLGWRQVRLPGLSKPEASCVVYALARVHGPHLLRMPPSLLMGLYKPLSSHPRCFSYRFLVQMPATLPCPRNLVTSLATTLAGF